MLHGYKKSRYNIYDNLEFLGLNLYEQKHFCFGEGDGDADGDAGADYDFSLSNPDAVASMAAAEAASQAQAAALSQAQIDEANQIALSDPTIDVAFSLDPGMVDLDVLNELQQNYYSMLEEWAALDDPNTRKFIQREIKNRRLNTPKYGIYNPEAMNRLEKRGYKTFGTGIRGKYEARFNEPQSRATYDPNNVTFASPDEKTTSKYLFTEFALENPNLTTVEALTKYNATSPVSQKVSVEDVQNMGYDLNAPVGPQASFNEAAREEGLAQGLGLVAQTIATGSPLGALTDIALSGTGKGVMGHMADMFEEATGVDLPEAPDIGIPSYAVSYTHLTLPTKRIV